MFKKTIFRVTVILSMVASKAAATIVPSWVPSLPDESSKWSDLSSSMAEPLVRRHLNPDIVTVVTNHQPWQNYEEAIRVTYAMATTSEVAELDELWAAVLIEKHGPDALSNYLSIRSQIELPTERGASRGYYVENWLWRVDSGSGST